MWYHLMSDERRGQINGGHKKELNSIFMPQEETVTGWHPAMTQPLVALTAKPRGVCALVAVLHTVCTASSLVGPSGAVLHFEGKVL